MTADPLFEIETDTRHGHLGETIITPLDERTGRVRATDPETSVAGAESIAYRAGSQKAKLLEAYSRHPVAGLTDEEACVEAGLSLRSCFWKRCSEMRQDGYIFETGQTRLGDAGVARMVCIITPLGLTSLQGGSTS